MPIQVDTPWPLEILDHKGNRHVVTMLPGDMVLYEGATCTHGREQPLEGDWFANVFIHFGVQGMLPPSEGDA